MSKSSKRRASNKNYVSVNQLTIVGFESPFHENLDPSNRWVVLAHQIPWDDLCNLYLKKHSKKSTGRPPLNPRIVIGATIIKHMGNLDDRETIAQITENMYLQYFLGYTAFSKAPPFDPSLFVEIRKRMGDELISEMNLCILGLSVKKSPQEEGSEEDSPDSPAQGDLLVDATACPQDIAYPTDLNLLNKSREITESIIDALHIRGTGKPRTYRRNARKLYLHIAQSKKPNRKKIRKGIGQQLRFLRRNIRHIETMLDGFAQFPLSRKEQKQYWILQTVYQQQLEMYREGKHHVSDRIVSLHQPHVRPIVRGKARAKVEFGVKLHLSLVNGFAFVDTLSWEAYNEGVHLKEYVENYKDRFGFYPAKVMADKAYCTRKNRQWLKEKHIKLAAKPLGRPSKKAVKYHVSPGERNPIEGKFGQAKNAYGLNRIRARLKQTSQSWISSIILVLNLVKLARQVSYFLSFSACAKHIIDQINTAINQIRKTERLIDQYSVQQAIYNQIAC